VAPRLQLAAMAARAQELGLSAAPEDKVPVAVLVVKVELLQLTPPLSTADQSQSMVALVVLTMAVRAVAMGVICSDPLPRPLPALVVAQAMVEPEAMPETFPSPD